MREERLVAPVAGLALVAGQELAAGLGPAVNLLVPVVEPGLVEGSQLEITGVVAAGLALAAA